MSKLEISSYKLSIDSKPYEWLFKTFQSSERQRLNNKKEGILCIAPYVYAGYQQLMKKEPIRYQKYPEPPGYGKHIHNSESMRNFYYYRGQGSDRHKAVTFADFKECDLSGDYGKDSSNNFRCGCRRSDPECIHYFLYLVELLVEGCNMKKVHTDFIGAMNPVISELKDGLFREWNGYSDETIERDGHREMRMVKLNDLVIDFLNEREYFQDYWDSVDDDGEEEEQELFPEYDHYIMLGKSEKFLLYSSENLLRFIMVFESVLQDCVYLLSLTESHMDYPVFDCCEWPDMRAALSGIMEWINSDIFVPGVDGQLVSFSGVDFIDEFSLDSEESISRKFEFLLNKNPLR